MQAIELDINLFRRRIIDFADDTKKHNVDRWSKELRVSPVQPIDHYP